MVNSTNATNNLGGNEMDSKISFLVQGTYHILSVAKNHQSLYNSFPAKVRRLSNGFWTDETVDLAYLFKGSKSPLYSFQRNTLIGQVIKIKNIIPLKANSGKTYNSYNWEIIEEGIDLLLDSDPINRMNNLIASKKKEAGNTSQQDSESFDELSSVSIDKLNNLIASRKQDAEIVSQEDPESFDEFGALDSIDQMNNLIVSMKQKNK